MDLQRCWANLVCSTVDNITRHSRSSPCLDRVAASQGQQRRSLPSWLHEVAQLLANAVGGEELGPVPLLEDKEAQEQLKVSGHGSCSRPAQQLLGGAGP